MLATTDLFEVIVFVAVAFLLVNAALILLALVMKRDAERHGPKDFDDHPELKGPSER